MKKAELYINSLCEAAMSHGWLQNEGNGSSVDNAEKEYNETKKVITNYILNLETKIKQLRKIKWKKKISLLKN